VTLQQREIQHIGEAIAGVHGNVSVMAAPMDVARYIVGELIPILESHCPGFDREAFRTTAKVSDGHTQAQTERIGQMAGFLDVIAPDSSNNVASKWLEYLASSVQLAWDNEEFEWESRDRDMEIIDQIAGNSVPAEMGLQWVIFTDLEIFQNYDPADGHPEMGADATAWCGEMLRCVARDGLDAWLQDALNNRPKCDVCGALLERDGCCPSCGTDA
jgi:hypothetical protein